MTFVSNCLATDLISLNGITARNDSQTSISFGNNEVSIAASSLKYNGDVIATIDTINNLKAASIRYDSLSSGLDATDIQGAIDQIAITGNKTKLNSK